MPNLKKLGNSVSYMSQRFFSNTWSFSPETNDAIKKAIYAEQKVEKLKKYCNCSYPYDAARQTGMRNFFIEPY